MPPPCSSSSCTSRPGGSNALFASAVAYAYLVASGLKAVTSPEQVRDLARLVKSGEASVRDIERELRGGACDSPLTQRCAHSSVSSSNPSVGRHAVPSTQYEVGSAGPCSGMSTRR